MKALGQPKHLDMYKDLFEYFKYMDERQNALKKEDQENSNDYYYDMTVADQITLIKGSWMDAYEKETEVHDELIYVLVERLEQQAKGPDE